MAGLPVKYNLHLLNAPKKEDNQEITDSIFIEGWDNCQRVNNAVIRCEKHYGFRFKRKKVIEEKIKGIRVWRIK